MYWGGGYVLGSSAGMVIECQDAKTDDVYLQYVRMLLLFADQAFSSLLEGLVVVVLCARAANDSNKNKHQN